MVRRVAEGVERENRCGEKVGRGEQRHSVAGLSLVSRRW